MRNAERDEKQMAKRVDGKMRELSITEIAKLASRKGAKKIAVENFLSTMGIASCEAAYGNLDMDARLYRWNAPTVRAIMAGITKACRIAK